MISCGIDAGTIATKVVLRQEGRIVSYLVRSSPDKTIGSIASQTFGEAVCQAGITVSDISPIVATGAGAREVEFASERYPESVCLARGIYLVLPGVDTILDIGADKALAMRCINGRAVELALNEKRTACTGAMLERMAVLLGTTIEASGELALRSTERLNIQSICTASMSSVESEVMSLLHRGNRVEDILQAAFYGLATRVSTVINRMQYCNRIALVGGVARNIGVVRAIEEILQRKLFIPENPEGVTALGAAIMAEELATQVRY